MFLGLCIHFFPDQSRVTDLAWRYYLPHFIETQINDKRVKIISAYIQKHIYDFSILLAEGK